jgi:hypothetical protein
LARSRHTDDREADERVIEPDVLDQHGDNAAVGRLHIEGLGERRPLWVGLDRLPASARDEPRFTAGG